MDIFLSLLPPSLNINKLVHPIHGWLYTRPSPPSSSKMDFKLDLKLPNEVDLSISKNEQVVLFASHQTDSMFILTSDLKKGGYERKDIKIEINEDGSRMTISGEKPNMITRGFQKTFIIPEGVALDKVKARFDQDQSRLTIRMPKLVKGVLAGDGIQELKHPTPVPGKGIPSAENQHADPKPKSQQEKNEEERKQQDPKPESQQEKIEEPKPESQQEKAAETEKTSSSSSSSTTTIIAGSTLLMSLIVVFFGFIRSKNESTKKTN